MLGGRDPVGVDRLHVARVGLAAPADQEPLGDRRRLVDLALGHRRLADPAGRLGDERQRHHRRPRQVVARLLVGDVDQLPEAPLRARASPAPTARRRAGRRSARSAGRARPAAVRAAAARRRAAPRPARTARCRRVPRCRRRGSAARRRPGRARRSRWRRRRRPRGQTGLRRWRSWRRQRSGRARRSSLAAPCPSCCSGPPPSSPRWSAPARCPRASWSRPRCAGSTSCSRRSNAFTHVAHESALAAADAIAPGDPRPFAGVPIAIKDNRAVAGMPLTMGSDLFGDFVAGPRRVPGPPAARGRLRDRRQDLDAGDGDPADHRAAPVRPDPQPVGPRPHAGRLERRRGRGGRGRDGAGRARQRRRRLDPDPRRLLRAGRAQAGARAGLGRARRRAQLPGLRRRADPHGPRHRRTCSTCWPAPSPATPPGPRRRRRPATRR